MEIYLENVEDNDVFIRLIIVLLGHTQRGKPTLVVTVL